MSDQEQIEMHIANCKCCLLADAMKNCAVCRFNIGLAEKVELPKAAIPLAYQLFQEKSRVLERSAAA